MTKRFSVEQHSQPSIQQLERALKIAAKVVAMYGDVYLPGFIRLRDEFEKARTIEEAKSYAIRLASS
jgi:hypothetical protein